jgi:hypothetical protein
MEHANMPPDTNTDILSNNAKSYAAAASRLLNGDQLDAALAPAFYLLVGFTLELLLKAVCMSGGASQAQLKSLGHDLHEAYTRAMQTGKVPRVMTSLGRLVLALDEQHKTHVFRYTPDVPEVEVPPPRYCIDVLNEAISMCLP